MKFFQVALFATSAFAALVERQSASAVGDAIGNIQSKTEALTSAINAYDGSDQEAVLNAANEVQSAIEAGTTAANGISGELSLSDALTLQDPTNSLAGAVEDSVNAAISKKDTFVSANTAGIVLDQLQGFQSAAQTFSSAVVSKVPAAAGGIAQGLIQPILDSLNKGIEAFTGLGSGSPTSTGAGPTGSAPTSTGAAPTGSKPTSSGAAPTGSKPTATPPPFTGGAAQVGAGFGAVALALVAAL